MQKQLIIAGFHRSGTSMLAQELNNAGLFIGNKLVGPHISNADGHYEDFDFLRLHEKILASENTTWQHASKKILHIEKKFEIDIQRIVEIRNNEHKEWGFKDPRTVLFLPQWQKKLDNPYSVVIYRHYEECVNSLLHRASKQVSDGFSSDINFWDDPTLAYRMWLTYNQNIVRHIKENPERTIVVSHSAMIDGFPIVTTLNDKFGFTLDTSVKSAVKKELLTAQEFPSFPLSDELKKELDETWATLQLLSTAPSNKSKNLLNTKTLQGMDEFKNVLSRLNISIEKNNIIQDVIDKLYDDKIELKDKISIIQKNRKIFLQFKANKALIETIVILIENSPGAIGLYFIITDVLRIEKNYQLAEFYILEVFKVTDKIYPYFYNHLALYYLHTNQLVLAENALVKAIQGNPNNPAFYITSSIFENKKCHYEKALSYIDKAISLLIDNPNREVVFSLRKIDILQTLGKEDDIKILLLSLANSYPEDERIKFKRKVLKEQTNTEVLDKVKVEEKILMQLREDENYFSKIVSLLNTLADGWARNDLLGRMVVILKSKQDVDSLMVKDTEKKQLIKTIYILWLQGFDNAPTLVKKCLESWVQKNPTWDIILLDESSLKKYINIDTYLDSKTISKASLSDIIRISLLNKYGGLWVDATTYCSRPLDDWLGRYIINGFFAFNFEKHLDIIPDRPIASWFLYGEKDNYIINQWYEKAMEYCQKTVMIGLNPPSSTKERWIRKETEEHYFWFHYLFDDLCKLNVTFKNLWENIPKSSEKGPHFIQNNGMLEVLSENVRMHIDLKKSPLYKLSYRYDKKKYNEQCNLYYLLNPQYTTMSIAATSYKVKDPLPYLHFVHIGKCGGTALMMAFKDQEIKLSDFHLKKPKVYNSDEKYIIWIRNPLHRFVSAFNFSLALIKLDTSTLDSNNLTIYNCLAPGRIRYKMRSNHTFSDEYDDLIEFFQTANNLAEALSNKDNTIKNKSLKLMRFPAEHINRGIGWYLDNGNFVKENNEKILFVGKVETMKTDMANLSKVLDISLKSSSKKIRENILYNKDLSELAVKNILDFYKSTDYKALEELHRLGWIDNNTYQSYYKY